MGSNQSFLENLEWRRAEKHFSGGAVDTTNIEKAIINAPSSFGLQPYKVYAVKNKGLKEKLKAVSYNQAQVTECDTLYVFCARSDLETRAEEYISATGAESMRGMLMGFLKNLPVGTQTTWAAKQAYIALGFGLAAAAEEQIASCPMEGFNTVEVAKLLKLPKTLTPCVFLAIGEKADNPEEHPRFRFSKSDLIEEVA